MPSINPTSQYRIQIPQEGRSVSAEELPTIIQFTEAQRVALEEAYEKISTFDEAEYRYAQEHAAKIYAQIEVKGEVVATVYDNGVTCSSYDGMKIVGTDGTAGLDVAKTRLDEIARQTNGKIRYSNFDQNAYGVGGIYATIPDSFPRPNAKSFGDLLDAFVEDRMRAKAAAASEKTAAEKVG